MSLSDAQFKRYPRPVVLAALYTFAAHYHSGQWSRGYRLLSRAGRAWKRTAGIEPRLDYWERLVERDRSQMFSNRSKVGQLYWYLVDEYGDSI